MPYSGLNVSYSNNGTMGPADAEILVSLNSEHHNPTAGYVAKLREELPHQFPDNEFFFQPADIVSQILNFGLSAPMDVQFIGNDLKGNLAVARKVMEKIRRIPGVVDTYIYQRFDQPRFDLAVDRSKASQIGLTERDVAQIAPTFWLNPANGVNYSLAAQQLIR